MPHVARLAGLTAHVALCDRSAALWKLEGDLAGVIHHQIGREWPASLGGNKLGKQISHALLQEPRRLSAADRLLQNDLIYLELAGTCVRLGLLANEAVLDLE